MRTATAQWGLAVGCQTYNDGCNTLSFSGFGSLQGGSGNDTFNVAALTVGNFDGGTGSNTFAGSFAGDYAGSLTAGNVPTASLIVGGNFNGNLTLTGGLQQVSITGNITAGSTLSTAGNVTGVQAGILAGNFLVGGKLGNATFASLSAGALLQAQGTVGLTVQGAVAGNITVPENSAIPGSGVMCSSTFGSVAATGHVTAGSIKSMSVLGSMAGFIGAGARHD